VRRALARGGGRDAPDLLDRGQPGRPDPAGQPVLYGTTAAFLERLGLFTIDELPPVEDLLPGPEVVEQLEERLRPGADA